MLSQVLTNEYILDTYPMTHTIDIPCAFIGHTSNLLFLVSIASEFCSLTRLATLYLNVWKNKLFHRILFKMSHL